MRDEYDGVVLQMKTTVDAFPGCKVEVGPDRATASFRATITLPSKRPGHDWGSFCSHVAPTAIEALDGVLSLAREPAPGFPGWVEPLER